MVGAAMVKARDSTEMSFYQNVDDLLDDNTLCTEVRKVQPNICCMRPIDAF